MVFVSYSHRDREWLDRLQVHLRPLEREQAIATRAWADTELAGGDRWREEIRAAIATAEVAVLLVSADFLASEFIVTHELPLLFDAAATGAVRVIPVVVSPCRYEQTRTLSDFQSVNDPRRPLTSLGRSEQEAVFVTVSEEVRAALLRPLARFREQLQETLGRADREFDRQRRQDTGLPSGSPADKYARAAWELAAAGSKAQAVLEMKIALDASDPFYRRKQVLLDDELATMRRHRDDLWKQMRSLAPFGSGQADGSSR
jgi:hypothetical protein